MRLAGRHAIVPLVDHHLARVAPDIVPIPVRDSLRAAAQQGAVESLQLTGELVAVMRAFEQSAIDAMPFKGPTLAALLYGDISLRQYQDLDVLVQRQDLSAARAMLLDLDFEPAEPMSDAQRASLLASGHHERFVHPASAATVELHWSLNDKTLTHRDIEHCWWRDRQPVTIGGVAMRTLGAERMLLYLCMHAGNHSWARLSWICDFQRALRAYTSVDWSAVWRMAAENGAQRAVSVGLALVDFLFEGETLTVTAAGSRPRDRIATELTLTFAHRLFAGSEIDYGVDFRVQLRSRERLRDKIRYAWHVLAEPHPADVMLVGLPRALHGAYYVFRPIRLAWKHLVRRQQRTRTA